MEMMCSCQAIDLRGKKKLGIGTNVAYNMIRKEVSKLIDDRELYEDINKCEELLISEKIILEVEKLVNIYL